MLPKQLDEEVARLHLDAAGREADDADPGAGRLHRRAGRGTVQAGALPLLTVRQDRGLQELARHRPHIAVAHVHLEIQPPHGVVRDSTRRAAGAPRRRRAAAAARRSARPAPRRTAGSSAGRPRAAAGRSAAIRPLVASPATTSTCRVGERAVDDGQVHHARRVAEAQAVGLHQAADSRRAAAGTRIRSSACHVSSTSGGPRSIRSPSRRASARARGSRTCC